MPAPPLPASLKRDPPSVKLLYLWLLPQGEVSHSQREISDALGITQANVSIALNRLGDLGLLEGQWSTRGNVRGRYRALPVRSESA